MTPPPSFLAPAEHCRSTASVHILHIPQALAVFLVLNASKPSRPHQQTRQACAQAPKAPRSNKEPQQAGEPVRPLQRPLIRAANKAASKAANTGKPTAVILRPDAEKEALPAQDGSEQPGSEEDNPSRAENLSET